MNAYRLLLLAAIASGCQVIGGITDRTEGPQGTSGGGSGGGTSSSSGGSGFGAATTGSGGNSASGGTGGSGGAAQPDAHTCILNSDCDNALVCIFATCSVPCRLDTDCGAGFRCLDTTAGAACVDSSTSTCDRTCPGGTTCIDGVCRAPCTVRNADAGLEAGVPGILDASTGCHSDQTCVNGGCVGGGTHDPSRDGGPTGNVDSGPGPSCSVGTHRCTDLIPQTCTAGGTWTDGAPCPYVCSSGACTGVCTPNAKQCNAKVPQTCSAAGSWQDGAPCPYVCTAGACTGVCTPNAKQCSNNDAQSCDATGTWSTTTCPSICVSGACATSCTSGAKQCNGTTPQTCNTVGNWVNGTACPYVCSGAGVCSGTCTPGAKRCTGTTPETCSAAGAWTSGAACSYLCSVGVCTGVCTPGVSKRCNGDTPQTCSATAQWVSGTTCDNTVSQCDPVTYTCKKFEGQACAAKADCVSNFCKDTYCCDTACTGPCQSCAIAGSLGTCSSVRTGPDSDSCSGINVCSASGQCKLVDGQQCSITSDCASGNCTTFLPDNDQDGYGSSTVSQKFCGLSPPSGYVPTGSPFLDCCDNDSRVQPGEQNQNTPFLNGSYGWYSTIDNCGSFDYDCSGSVQQVGASYTICNAATCQGNYCIDASNGCGVQSVFYSCTQSSGADYVYCK